MSDVVLSANDRFVIAFVIDYLRVNGVLPCDYFVSSWFEDYAIERAYIRYLKQFSPS